jgi:hypothetical protein
MKSVTNGLFAALSLALVASVPLVRAQDQSAPPANSGSSTAPADQSDQTPPPPKKGKGKRPDMGRMLLQGVPDVTDDQKQQLQQIGQDSREQIRTIMQDDSLSRDDKRQKMMAMQKDMIAKMRAVLNADQQKVFDENVAKVQERMKQMRKKQQEQQNQ